MTTSLRILYESWGSTMKVEGTAPSSVETEYMAMCRVASEAVWLTRSLEDIGIDL